MESTSLGTASPAQSTFSNCFLMVQLVGRVPVILSECSENVGCSPDKGYISSSVTNPSISLLYNLKRVVQGPVCQMCPSLAARQDFRGNSQEPGQQINTQSRSVSICKSNQNSFLSVEWTSCEAGHSQE